MVYTGDANIINCTIHDNMKIGMTFFASATAAGNDIYNNKMAISISGSPHIENNTLRDNDWGIFAASAVSFPTIEGNLITNNAKGGIYSETAPFYPNEFIIRNNTISYNGDGQYPSDGYGIDGKYTVFETSGNLIYGNLRWGIHAMGGRIASTDDVFENQGTTNGEGQIRQTWMPLINFTDEDGDLFNDPSSCLGPKTDCDDLDPLTYQGYYTSLIDARRT